MTYNVLNNKNNDEVSKELKCCFGETSDIKTQEYSVLKYLNFRIYQSLIGLIIKHTKHIMELVTEWLHDGKFCKSCTSLYTDYAYKKNIMHAIPMIGEALRNPNLTTMRSLVTLLDGFNKLLLLL